MAQVELLQALGERSPARIGDLAARQQLAASTVSGLVAQLIDAGLAARAVDPSDRRASVVTLTDAGQQQLTTLTGALERSLDSALDALDDTDRAAIRGALPALFRLARRLAESPAGAALL